MFIDVTLCPEDGFGRPVGDSLHAFWIDGSKLQSALNGRMTPADPWPAWTCLIDLDEARELARKNACVWVQRGDFFDAKMASLINTEGARSIRLRVEES